MIIGPAHHTSALSHFFGNPQVVLSKKEAFIRFPEKETKASRGEVTYVESAKGPTAACRARNRAGRCRVVLPLPKHTSDRRYLD